MPIPPADLREVPVSDFCSFVGLREDMLGGLVSVGEARLEGSEAPAWLLEYRLSDFAGLAPIRSTIPIPGSIERSVPARQASFLFGRVAARAGVKGLLGRDAPLPVGVRGAPVWPESLSGSISHTDTHAISWVRRSEAGHIGIDLERRMSDLDLEAIGEQVMSAQEAEILSTAFSGEHWPEGVTVLFSAKEAAYKALSPLVARYLDFHDIEIEAIDLAQSTLSLRRSPRLKDEPLVPARMEVHFATLGGSILTYVDMGLRSCSGGRLSAHS
jgi:enterobactin synthetase component D